MSILVSVIVPIFGVELYLEKCIKSIINQTYKNIEIILIDDGSPDRCPEICDEFAKKDKRIKVIHKKNGGLSDARNAGITIAKGDYLVFVDGDDWIKNTMIEHLLNACLKYNVELSSCARYVTNGDVVKAVSFCSAEKVYFPKDAFNEIFSGKSIDVAAWDKIYAKHLFDTIRFPVGENNEDIAVFYKIIEKAGRIVHCGTAEYYYQSRPGSITKLKYSNEARKIIEKNLNSIEKFIENKYPMCMNSFLRYKAVNIYALLNKYIKCNDDRKTAEYNHLIEEFISLRRYFFKDEKTSIKGKTIAVLMLLNLYGPYLKIKKMVKGYK